MPMMYKTFYCYLLFPLVFLDWPHLPHFDICSVCPFFSVTLALLNTPWPSYPSVWLITEQNWLQAWDTKAFLKNCSYTNPKQKINSWINCWACLVDQSFAIIAARENWRQHVCSYLPAAKLGTVLTCCLMMG